MMDVMDIRGGVQRLYLGLPIEQDWNEIIIIITVTFPQLEVKQELY